MTPEEYIKNALRTESHGRTIEGDVIHEPRVQHAILGMVTESVELLDDIKKATYYGKPIDRVHLIEEAGDVMWYLAVLADALGVSFEELWEKNINKLRARYPEKYNDLEALNRDLDKERQELEK